MIRQRVAIVAAHETVIAGGGPAGLTAAYELSKHGKSCVVLESDPRLVGGISRTDQYKGYRFDIGGHRFFSKSDEVNRLWREILGEELLTRIAAEPHLLRPQVLPLSAQAGRRPLEARASCDRAGSCASYIKAKLAPIKPERSVEDWVVNRFGRVLFETFFKSYTEKVWGMPTTHDLGRLGGAADQGPEPGPGGHLGPVRPVSVEAGRGDQDLDRRVSVSAARARPDVGSGPRPDSRAGRGGPARPPRGRRSSTTDRR